MIAQPLYGVVESQIARAQAVTDRVVINEIMANPVSGELEWVELYNPTNATISMDDWRIKDGTTNFSGVFDDVAAIPAKGFVVREASGTASQLNDTTQEVKLVSDASNTLVDSVTYAGIAEGKTYSRTYDAANSWVAQASPTKGVTNGAAPVVAPQPTLSFVANHRDESGHATSSWRGISVEIKTPNLTDATKVTVTINRTNGAPDVWVSNPNRLDAINGLNGAGHNTTAPLVIAEGTRTRTDATKSWVTESAPWTNNQAPQNVHVTVERENGEPLTESMSVGNVWGTTWVDTAANLPAPEVPVVVPTKESYTVKDGTLQGWGIYNDGKSEFVTDNSAVGNGALKITTEDEDQMKMVYRSVPTDQQFLLRNLDAYQLAFDTKRLDGPAHASSTYAMYVDMDGSMTTTSDREYIVYEPANNDAPGHNYNGWTTWNLDLAGTYWYKANGKQIAVKGTSYVGTNPNAVVMGLAINQGSGNPGWITLVDNVVTHNGIYDFEPAAPADTAAPEILSISPAANSVVKDTQEFAVHAIDESGVEKIALYIWREDNTKAKEVALKQDTEDQTRWIGSVDTAALGNGEYQLGLRVVALDGTNKVKLYNNRKESHKFTIDNANPVVRNVKLSDAVINGDEIKKNKLPMLSADVDGTGSNVDRAEYRIHTAAGEKIDGFNWVLMDAADDNFDQKNELVEKALDVNGLSDGDYLVRVRAFDAADNKKSGNDIQFRVDTKQATVAIDTPQDGALISGTKKFSLTVEDDYGVNKVAMYVNKDGTKVREFALKQSDDTWYYDVDTARLAGDGEYKISFRAVDNSGNVTYVNNRLNSYSVFVDNTVPEVKIHAPVLSHGSDPIIKGVAEDVSGIKSHWFEITHPTDGLFYVFGKSEFNLSEAKDNKSPKNAINIVDGKYKIRYVATDNVGNRSDAPNYTNPTIHYMTIDRSPVLSGVYFVPQEDHLSVGFSVNRFKDTSSVKVELLDENGDVVVTNIGDSESMKTLLNGRNGEISSPFYFTNELPTDEYWTFGKVDWTKVATPVSARVTVAYGGSSVKTAPIDATESELGYTYEALVAQYAKSISTGSKKPAQSQTTKTPESVSGTAADEEGLLTIPNDLQSPFTQVTSPVFRAFGSFASNNPTPVADIDDESSEVLGSRAEAQSRSSGEVLGTSDQADEANQAGWGMAWYWWLVILAGLGLIGWMIAAAVRRRREDAQLGF